MSERTGTIVYFSRPGAGNTERTIEIARRRADELGACSVLVASTSGATGVLAARVLGERLVVVSHSTGFGEPNAQEMTAENRVIIEAAGAKVLTAQHAFGGVGRAVRRKLGTYQVDEFVAYTLRTFGEGVKVCAEMALMAADAGLVRAGEPTVAVAGAGRGADTAVVLRPAHAQDFFDLRFLEVLCMPSPMAL